MAVTETAAAERLGSGGEADVYRVPGRPDLAEKRWREPTMDKARKLELMLAHPPEGAVADGHVNLAWPVAAVRRADGAVIGFRMPAVDLGRAVPVFSAYNPHARREELAGTTWRHLVRSARNLSSVVAALHRAGYVVGDLNESNVLVDRRALVTVLDCDSIQVCDPSTGEIHHCGVARPEFLAPELAGRDLSITMRKPAADRFALAVMVFLLLREGVHPYAGVWRGRGEPPDLTARMRGRRFPYLPGSRLAPPPHGLGTGGLGVRISLMFFAAFVLGPVLRFARPSAAAWEKALAGLESRLTTCRRSPTHVRVGRRRCSWCRRVDRGLPDAWPGADGRGIRRRRAGWARRQARALRAGARRGRRRFGLWTAVRSRAFLPAASAASFVLLAAVLVPGVVLPASALVLLAARGRFGSLRLTTRRGHRLWKRRLRNVRPGLWWAASAALVLASWTGRLG